MITRAHLALFLSVSVLLGIPRVAHAQQVDVGSRIRLVTGTEQLQGQLAAMVGDSLLVRQDGHYVVRAVCICDLLSFQVSAGKPRLWIAFGAVGAVVGAVAAEPIVESGLIDDPGFVLSGLLVTAAIVLYPLYAFVSEDQAVEFAGGVAGAALGVGIGLMAASDRWRAVDYPQRWGLVIAPDPGVGMRVGVRIGL